MKFSARKLKWSLAILLVLSEDAAGKSITQLAAQTGGPSNSSSLVSSPPNLSNREFSLFRDQTLALPSRLTPNAPNQIQERGQSGARILNVEIEPTPSLQSIMNRIADGVNASKPLVDIGGVVASVAAVIGICTTIFFSLKQAKLTRLQIKHSLLLTQLQLTKIQLETILRGASIPLSHQSFPKEDEIWNRLEAQLVRKSTDDKSKMVITQLLMKWRSLENELEQIGEPKR